MRTDNYYHILGLDETASQEDIKQAYRKLAKKYHPDLDPNDTSREEKFIRINEAYSVLSDASSKRDYDFNLASVEYTDIFTSNREYTYQTTPYQRTSTRTRTGTKYSLKTKIYGAIFMGGLGILVFSIMIVLSRASSSQHYERGVELTSRKQYVQAIGSFEKGIMTWGNHSYKSCIKICEISIYELQRAPLALQYSHIALSYASDSSEIAYCHYLNALAHKSKNDFYSSLQNLKTATTFGYSPDSVFLQKALIYTYHLKKYVSGHNAFLDLVKVNPASELGWFGVAWCEQQLNLYEKAIDSYGRLIKLNPSLAKAYYYRGINEIVLEQKSNACKDFYKAKELGLNEAQERYALHCGH
ncbi:DnaJ domain-containing protein [Fulvivirga ligni]|uniref:DnaJ domain-containing protein n=1 Tax=Fulvivirga ligni TaxID=2904246 RepID=UPI001F2C4615|nr:DnaJ domain-containing protein [Fulvivirga ligni]UII19302.1 DnaJ domain-containing protein [Fulvivirga ligni]